MLCKGVPVVYFHEWYKIYFSVIKKITLASVDVFVLSITFHLAYNIQKNILSK